MDNSNERDSLTRKVVVRDNEGNVIEERSFTIYADLLAAIHKEGIKSLETEVIQLPESSNGQMAVVRATLQAGIGTFTALGDASPESVEPDFVPHLLRVAETRAKARALRDALGIGLPAIEELTNTAHIQPASQTFNEDREGGSHMTANPMTENQKRYLFRLLSTKGLEGDAAKQHLLKAFEVNALADVTRNAASSLIDRLLGENGNGTKQGTAHA